MMQSLSNVNFFQDGHFVFRNQFFFKGQGTQCFRFRICYPRSR